jgi:hypothetical protein
MTNILDRYNLRPQEKRLVVGVAFVLFVVINIWFVWPHFHDWSDLQETLRKSRVKLSTARQEIERTKGASGYEAKLKRLENEGDPVQPEDQSIQFQVSVDRIARQSMITPSSVSPVSDSTDPATSKFFVQKSLQLGFENTEERVLVNFLYNLGTRSSLFRVKEMDVKPAAGQYRLNGRVTIIASYLKDLAKLAPVASTNKLTSVRPPAPMTNKLAGAVAKPPGITPGMPPGRTPGQFPPGTNRFGLPSMRPFSPTNSLHRPLSPATKQ